MADTKIASLTDGLTTSGTDRIPVAISPYGSGNNAYITPSYLKTFMVTGGTVTSSTPVFDMTQTWNSGAVTFSGLKLNVTDTASASASLLMDLQVGGSSVLSATKTGRLVSTSTGFSGSGNGGAFTWPGGTIGSSSGTPFFQSGNSSLWFGFGGSTPIVFSGLGGSGTQIAIVSNTGTLALGLSSDVILSRDAANTLALQNGTSAQTLNIYNTWSSAGANYERIALFFSSNLARLAVQRGGTGVDRDLLFYVGSQDTWKISASTGSFLTTSDNAFDIGASGANRPRNLYVAGTATVGGSVSVANGSGYLTAGLGGYYAQSDGVIKFQNNAGADFGRIQLGGTTSSFPAIKRSGPAVAFRRADDTIGTFADLPAAASGNEGAVYSISDCNTSTWGATAAGGGSTHAMVRSNGTNWTVIGV